MLRYREIENVDPEVAKSIYDEIERQSGKIELIASENFVSKAVLEAVGSPLTNKYAEGYPGKRYYGGCEHVDVIEELANNRAKEIFGAEHVNVQPHSGAQANMAVFFSVLKPGDVFMGLNLSHGGHLSHGMHLNMSGKYFKPVQYCVKESDGLIDYDELRKTAEVKPKMIVAGASAYPRTIDFKAFREICDEVGLSHGRYGSYCRPCCSRTTSNPVPYADFVTTTTHKTLRGPRNDSGKKYAKNCRCVPRNTGWSLMHVVQEKLSLRKRISRFKEQKQIVKNAKALSRPSLKRTLTLFQEALIHT